MALQSTNLGDLAGRKARAKAVTVTTEPVAKTEAKPSPLPTPEAEEIAPPPQPIKDVATHARGRGVKGKSSSSLYRTKGMILRESTILALEEESLELKREGKLLDVSELADMLLEGWLQKQKAKRSRSQTT